MWDPTTYNVVISQDVIRLKIRFIKTVYSKLAEKTLELDSTGELTSVEILGMQTHIERGQPNRSHQRHLWFHGYEPFFVCITEQLKLVHIERPVSPRMLVGELILEEKMDSFEKI